MRASRTVFALPSLVALAILPLAALPRAAAQSAHVCSTGPGSAFGVTAYQCANCGIEQRPGDRHVYQFFAEPVILEVDDQTPLRAGDIVEAVDGKPITTRAGAQAFTYPSGSESTVTLRRDGRRLDVAVELIDLCPEPPKPPTPPTPVVPPRPPTAVVPGQPVRPPTPPTVAPTPTPVPTPMPVVRPRPAERTGRFGLALGCLPSCTKARASNGTDYYRFDGPPPVVALRLNGPADRAGVQVGDHVTHVDGLSITNEAGALRFLEASRGSEMRLTLEREGERIEVLLQVP